MNEMTLPKGALYVIEKLNKHGYRADAVGGCVRDFLLSRPCDDCDITTSATPEEVKAVFSADRTIDTGIKHGTVTVLVEGVPFEVTTYRFDGEYLDNRHPSSVTFTRELREDLARRDFTVNAMCYNPKDGYTDLFGGMDDLSKRTIRAVGDATTRFCEDALRILRAVRFSSVLDFKIEKSTADAVHASKHLLSNVSRERIYVEWRKLLSGVAAHRVLDEYRDVIAAAIPELSELKLPGREAFARAGYTARLLSLYRLSTPDPVRDFSASMRSLKTDNAIRELGETVLSAIGTPVNSITDALFLLNKCDSRGAVNYIELMLLTGELGIDAWHHLNAAFDSGIPYRISDLAVGGRELMDIGLRGKAVGDTLSLLLNMVMSGEVGNEREALLLCAEKQK